MAALQPIYLNDDLSAWERRALELKVSPPLMEQAGAKAAIRAIALARAHPGPFRIVTGRGDNGGDGLVVARILHEQGVPCEVMQVYDGPPGAADALLAWHKAQSAGVALVPFRDALDDSALIVDAIFGSGLNRAPKAEAKDAIEAINRARQKGVPVLALDVPSGLIGNTGVALAPTVCADETVSFLAIKPGLYTGQGPDFCGRIVIAPLSPVPDIATPGFLNDPLAFKALLRARKKDSNKGSFGTIAVIGGARGSTGAVLLAARAALFCGAGKVFVQMLADQPLSVDLVHPELMLQARIDLDHADVVVIGPGLGQSEEAKEVLQRVLTAKLPAVFDADALNLMSRERQLLSQLHGRAAATVLTPHPLEAARLLDEPIDKVQGDRVSAALRLATRHNVVVILKGTGSIIAEPSGRFAINPSGNPGLASGGTGDVLSGVCGALLGQGQAAFDTVLCACFIHGDGADRLVAAGVGPIGMTASELIPAIRASLNHRVASYS